MAGKPKDGEGFVEKLKPLQRMLISIAVAVLVWLAMSAFNLHWLTRLIVAWSSLALSHNVTSWIVFFKRTPAEIKQVASKEDGSRIYVFIIILLTSIISFGAVVALMLSNKENHTPQGLYVTVIVCSMLFSWMMVHTLFTFHYAYHFYDPDAEETKQGEGLEFPGTKQPDYLDFAYFSFCLGMTFQTSDVEINSSTIRRLVLLHTFLSYLLNTFVVALSINVIAGLLEG